MPRIVFSRLKVSEQKQIAAGATVPIGSEASVSSLNQLSPDSGCMYPMTTKHGCRIIFDPNYTISSTVD